MTSILVLLAVVVGLIALRFLRANALVWLVAWWVAIYVGIRFAVSPPLPSSIIGMFMGISSVALLTYVFADSQRLEEARGPVIRFMTDRRYNVALVIVALVIPGLVAAKVYTGMAGGVSAPAFGRTIHPAPPGTINFKGKVVDLIEGQNPYRELEKSDPEQFAAHVAEGRRVYFQNCVFCHGDNMEGNGIFAHGFDPFPANFAEPTTIAMLQETYLFWRISKGAPGLPEESGPWASAMPAWQNFLTEEEIWDVILFLYDHTGQRPRAREEHS